MIFFSYFTFVPCVSSNEKIMNDFGDYNTNIFTNDLLLCLIICHTCIWHCFSCAVGTTLKQKCYHDVKQINKKYSNNLNEYDT